LIRVANGKEETERGFSRRSWPNVKKIKDNGLCKRSLPIVELLKEGKNARYDRVGTRGI